MLHALLLLKCAQHASSRAHLSHLIDEGTARGTVSNPENMGKPGDDGATHEWTDFVRRLVAVSRLVTIMLLSIMLASITRARPIMRILSDAQVQ